MNLGPGTLVPSHRKILKKTAYRRVLRLYRRGKLEWKDTLLADVKAELRLALRHQQDGRCMFCRRRIIVERKNAYESIEHFLDKSKAHYKKWSFSPVNLTVACHACNFQKSTIDLGDGAIKAAIALKSTSGGFKWIHPYFDNFHENIEVLPGWIYRVKDHAPKAAEAEAMIVRCDLNQIRSIEAYAQLVKRKVLRLTELAGRCVELEKYGRAAKLLAESKRFQKDTWAV